MAGEDAETWEDIVAATSRREHQRVALNLIGRYMLEDRREYPCQTIDVSPGGCALIAPVPGALNERVIVYVNQIGRIEGRIVRLFDGGFALTLTDTPLRREKLAAVASATKANDYEEGRAKDL